MTRIGKTLHAIRAKGEKALTIFLTGGYPTNDATKSLVPFLADAGADIIEIGMPFSDPLADGPVIQESSTVSLRNGTTLAKVLEDVGTIRLTTDVPLVLMGYLNPILRYGTKRFFRDASAAGVDGMILPEIPLEELDRFTEYFRETGMDRILLVTPTTSAERIQALDRASSGFVYCVSTTGVTGGAAEVLDTYLRSVRTTVTCNPLQIGFGISTPADVRRFARFADGVIVGSALIRRLKQNEPRSDLGKWVKSLKDALI